MSSTYDLVSRSLVEYWPSWGPDHSSVAGDVHLVCLEEVGATRAWTECLRRLDTEAWKSSEILSIDNLYVSVRQLGARIIEGGIIYDVPREKVEFVRQNKYITIKEEFSYDLLGESKSILTNVRELFLDDTETTGEELHEVLGLYWPGLPHSIRDLTLTRMVPDTEKLLDRFELVAEESRRHLVPQEAVDALKDVDRSIWIW